MIGSKVKAPIYTAGQENLRWNVFKNKDPETMFNLFTRPQGNLFEPPFTYVHNDGLIGIFDDAQATKIIKILDKVNHHAMAVGLG